MTLIDNSGGDPTAFGKTLSDIGSQMIHNRLAKVRSDQHQQALNEQQKQFQLQHALALKHLDMQQKEFDFRKKALEDAQKIQNASNLAFEVGQRPQALQAQAVDMPNEVQAIPNLAIDEFIKANPDWQNGQGLAAPQQPATPEVPAATPQPAEPAFSPNVQMIQPGPPVRNAGAAVTNFIDNLFRPKNMTVEPLAPSEFSFVTPPQPAAPAPAPEEYKRETEGGFTPVPTTPAVPTITREMIENHLANQTAYNDYQKRMAEINNPAPVAPTVVPARTLNSTEFGPELQQELIQRLIASGTPLAPALQNIEATQKALSSMRGESSLTQEQPNLKQLLEIGQHSGVNGMEFYDPKTRRINMEAYMNKVGDNQALLFQAQVEQAKAKADADRAALLNATGNKNIMQNMSKADEKLLSESASKLSNYDAVLAQLEEAKKIIDDPNLPETAKVSKAEGIAKILNTPEGTDAVSGDEAERILRYVRKNFNVFTAATDSTVDFGRRNFPAFSEQISQQIKKVQAVRDTAQSKIADVNQRYGLQTGQPPQPNSPSTASRVVKLKDGRRVRIDSNNQILETLSK